jgi:iron complex outermembrane recepter protein
LHKKGVSVKKLLFLLLLLPFYSLEGQSQEACNLLVKGRVCEHQTHAPLLGTTVFVKELGRGTVVAQDGSFAIEQLCHGVYHLEFRCMGYHTHVQRIVIEKHTTELPLICLHESAALLDAVTVSGSFLDSEAKRQSLHSTQLSQEELKKYQSITLSNALERIAGVSTINTGVGISKPVIRGMSQNRVRVNDLGIKQEDQQWGTDHGLQIDVFSVEEIEILRGAAALRYGADAIGGVINIRPAPFPFEATRKAAVQTSYRSNNDLFALSAFAEQGNNDYFVRLRLSTQQYADYRVPATSFLYNTFVLPIHDGRLKNTAGREYNTSLQVGKVYSKSAIRLTISNFNQEAGLFPGTMGIPRSYQLRHDGNFRNIDLPNQYNNHLKTVLNHVRSFTDSYLETDIGYQYNLRLEKSAPHAHGNFIPDTDLALGLHLQTLSWNSRWVQNLKRGERSIGINTQHQQNRIDGYEFLIPNYNSTTAGIFWIEERQFSSKIGFNGGLRYELAHHRAAETSVIYYNQDGSIDQIDKRNAALQRSFHNLTASAGIAYQINPQWNLKLNAANVFRPPHVVELTANGVHHGTFRHERGDADLQSERGYQADVVLSWTGKRARISFSPFYNYFANYLFLRPAGRFSPLPEAGQIYQYSQAEALHTGFELETQWQFSPKFEWNANFAYLYNLNLDTYLPLPFTPPVTLFSEWEYKPFSQNKWKHTYLSFSVQHFAAQNRTDRNEKSTEGYTLLNLRAGTQWQMGKRKIKMYTQVENLTNQVYMNHLSRYRLLNLPEAGRNVNLNLIFEF